MLVYYTYIPIRYMIHNLIALSKVCWRRLRNNPRRFSRPRSVFSVYIRTAFPRPAIQTPLTLRLKQSPPNPPPDAALAASSFASSLAIHFFLKKKKKKRTKRRHCRKATDHERKKNNNNNTINR